MLVSDVKTHLTGLLHGGTLNKLRNVYYVFERASNTFLQKCKPLETMRTAALSSMIYDDVYNYSLPSDFNSLIDLIPQDNRTNWDMAFRRYAGQFDLEKAIKQKTVSIEGSEGSKIIRINWRTRQGKVLHTMNSLTSNGTWSAVGSAANLKAQTISKISGNASIEFDVVATGDGIQNTTMTAVDFTDEDEIADPFYWVYLGSDYAHLTSIGFIFGNDLTANYWTSVVQTTQADGRAFQTGWNLIRSPWTTATETGTVTPASIDSCKIVFNTTGTLSNVRIDNIILTVGRNFDLKYYSKFLFKNSAGTYITRPTTDEDTVLVDNDSLPIFLHELLKVAAHQLEGTDSAFDINYATSELVELYPSFRSEQPDQRKKAITRYASGPRFQR